MFREITKLELSCRRALVPVQEQSQQLAQMKENPTPPDKFSLAVQAIKSSGLEEDIIFAWIHDLKVQNVRKKLKELGWES